MNTEKLLILAIDAAIKAGMKTLEYYSGEMDILVKEDNSPLTLADLESNQIIETALLHTGIHLLSEEKKMVSYGERKKWKKFWLIDPLDGTKEFIKKSDEFSVNIALIENGLPVMGVVYVPAMDIIYFGSELGSYKNTTNQFKMNTEEVYKTAKKISVNSNAEKEVTIVASKSHIAEITKKFIENIQKQLKKSELKSYGSSFKLCMVAEGAADIYPRFGPTMEWDIAASYAVAVFAGAQIRTLPDLNSLLFNKEDVHNPSFIVFAPVFEKIIQKSLDEM